MHSINSFAVIQQTPLNAISVTWLLPGNKLHQLKPMKSHVDWMCPSPTRQPVFTIFSHCMLSSCTCMLSALLLRWAIDSVSLHDTRVKAGEGEKQEALLITKATILSTSPRLRDNTTPSWITPSVSVTASSQEVSPHLNSFPLTWKAYFFFKACRNTVEGIFLSLLLSYMHWYGFIYCITPTLLHSKNCTVCSLSTTEHKYFAAYCGFYTINQQWNTLMLMCLFNTNTSESKMTYFTITPMQWFTKALEFHVNCAASETELPCYHQTTEVYFKLCSLSLPGQAQIYFKYKYSNTEKGKKTFHVLLLMYKYRCKRCGVMQ